MKSAYPVAAPETKTDRVLAWRGPLEVSMPALAQLGYDGVELMVRGPEEFDADRLLRLADKTGLAIAAVGTGPMAIERGLSLSAADDALRREAIRAGEGAIHLAGRLGANLTIGAFRGRCEPQDVAAAIDRFTESIIALLPLAEQYQVQICLEPQNRFQSSFFRTVAETLPWLKQIGHPGLGLSLDTFHMNLEESSLASALHAARDHLFYLQLADNHRGPPGTGLFAWDEFRRRLHEADYIGWACMEIVPPGDHWAAAELALEGFRRILCEEHS